MPNECCALRRHSKTGTHSRNANPSYPLEAIYLARSKFPGDNRCVNESAAHGSTFAPGVLVLLTLTSPREKVWGALLRISGAGVSIRGVELGSYEEGARALRSGEPFTPATVFFPMHRVERVEIDARDGELPSLAERFRDLSGRHADEFFGVIERPTIPPIP
jgi:hypothetical protein